MAFKIRRLCMWSWWNVIPTGHLCNRSPHKKYITFMVLFWSLQHTLTCPFKTTFTRICYKLFFCGLWWSLVNEKYILNKRYNDICNQQKKEENINLINAINEHEETFPETFFCIFVSFHFLILLNFLFHKDNINYNAYIFMEICVCPKSIINIYL